MLTVQNSVSKRCVKKSLLQNKTERAAGGRSHDANLSDAIDGFCYFKLYIHGLMQHAFCMRLFSIWL